MPISRSTSPPPAATLRSAPPIERQDASNVAAETSPAAVVYEDTDEKATDNGPNEAMSIMARNSVGYGNGLNTLQVRALTKDQLHAAGDNLAAKRGRANAMSGPSATPRKGQVSSAAIGTDKPATRNEAPTVAARKAPAKSGGLIGAAIKKIGRMFAKSTPPNVFSEFVKDPTCRAALQEQLKSEYSLENFNFMESTGSFAGTFKKANKKEQEAGLGTIMENFIGDRAPQQINLPSTTTLPIMEAWEQQQALKPEQRNYGALMGLLGDAQKEVFQLVSKDSFRRLQDNIASGKVKLKKFQPDVRIWPANLRDAAPGPTSPEVAHIRKAAIKQHAASRQDK